MHTNPYSHAHAFSGVYFSRIVAVNDANVIYEMFPLCLTVSFKHSFRSWFVGSVESHGWH